MKKIAFCIPYFENIIYFFENTKFSFKIENQFSKPFYFPEDLLKYIFNLKSDTDFPLAALIAKSNDLDIQPSYYWGRLTPITLKADWAGIYMLKAFTLKETLELLPNFFQILDEWLKINDLPGTEWFATYNYDDLLFKFPAKNFSTVSYENLLGKEISQMLPSGDCANAARRWLTEWQMLIQYYTQLSQLPINALWIDSIGVMPPSSLHTFDCYIFTGARSRSYQYLFDSNQIMPYDEKSSFNEINAETILFFADELYFNDSKLSNSAIYKALINYMKKIYAELNSKVEIEIWSLQYKYKVVYKNLWLKKLFFRT